VRVEKMPTNSRQAAVRKYGMQIAKGDYIIHCDSDDWVDADLYEKMYLEAIRSRADVVFCPRVDEYADRTIRRSVPTLPKTGKELIASWYCTNIGMHTWNKLVNRRIFLDNEIYPFDGINLWEDNGLMLRAFYYVNKISAIKDSAYHYNQANINAISVSYGHQGIEQMIKCAMLIDDFYSNKQDAERYTKTVNALKFLAKINLVTTRYDWLKEFYALFPESNEAVNYISLNAFSTKGKIRFLFVKYHMAWLFVTLFKCFSVVQCLMKRSKKK
jgi:glycosyltransferase involved in cell wall biosynthesis